jgi:hypothetical protein
LRELAHGLERPAGYQLGGREGEEEEGGA